MEEDEREEKIVQIEVVDMRGIVSALKKRRTKVEQHISREIKKMSPFVYCEIFKKFAKSVKDYAVISIKKDAKHPGTVIMKQVEPEKKNEATFKTNTFTSDEALVMMVKLDNKLIMLTYEEMEEAIKSHPPANSNPALPEWALDYFDCEDEQGDDDFETLTDDEIDALFEAMFSDDSGSDDYDAGDEDPDES